MTDTTKTLDLDALQRLADAASDGPWFYDSYSRVFSQPKVAPYDLWSGPLIDAGHTLDRYGHCGSCDTRPLPEGRSPQVGPGCAFGGEDYRRDPLVARVPASAGDSAHGNHQADAEFIAAMREAVPELIAEVRRLRTENIDLNLIVANRRPTGTGLGPRCPRCGEHTELRPTWAVCPPCAVAEGWEVA